MKKLATRILAHFAKSLVRSVGSSMARRAASKRRASSTPKTPAAPRPRRARKRK